MKLIPRFLKMQSSTEPVRNGRNVMYKSGVQQKMYQRACDIIKIGQQIHLRYKQLRFTQYINLSRRKRKSSALSWHC